MISATVFRCFGLAVGVVCASAAPAQQVAPASPTPYQRAIAAGYKAAMYCSGIFNAGRTGTQIDRDELKGIYPEYDAIVPTLTAKVDQRWGVVSVAFDAALPPRRAEWSAGKGCTTLPIGLGDGPTVMDDAPDYPRADHRPDLRPWPMGDRGIRPRPPRPLVPVISRAFNGSYGVGSKTVGVIVVHRGRIVAERYGEGFGPFVSNRTWSAAKSFAGALFGHLQAQGRADVTKPARIPQWGARATEDPRVAITNDQLLRMASGLHSESAGNRTDAIYFGGVSVDNDATGWPLIAPPGTRFRYANNDTLLAMLSLGQSFRDEFSFRSVPREFFAKLGMGHTVAETDWRGNFILCGIL